jgi:general secretion pathway protein F
MPAYSFEALDADGKTRKGIIDADSVRAARTLLREQSLAPLTVEQAGQTQQSSLLSRQVHSSRVMRGPRLAIWTRQLAGLVSAGLTLERSLTALIDEAENEAARGLVANLRAEVNAGSPLARAMEQYPREFEPIYTAVIAAGEQGGRLGDVLTRLADDLEERQELKSKLIGAALYPTIVICMATAIVIFLVSYVVPQIATVFEGAKHSLPLITLVMLAISGFVRSYGLWMLGLLTSLTALGRWALKMPQVRMRWDALWLRLPVIGQLARGYNAARFAGTLAMLANSGVPILRALQAAAETLSNQALRADAQDALVRVREGAPLASALAQKRRFPSLLPMFARLGEQTGELPAMLDRVARQLSSQVQRRAMYLATILEPLLIVAMGLIVMLIVLSVMLPIMELNNLVK